MSGIRNPGFELGNIDFWTVETAGALEIETLLPKYGAYCGKFTSGGDGQEFIINNDYKEVAAHSLVEISGWVKSTAIRGVYPSLYMYDSDYSYIGNLWGYGRAMDATYLHIVTQIPIPAGVKYVRAGYQIQGSAVDDVFYLDGYNYHVMRTDECISGVETLINENVVIASGNTRSDMKDMQMFKSFEADLIVDYNSGVNETLDVVVYEINLEQAKQIVGTFAQVLGETQERITLSHCTGRQMHIEYIIAGTNPEFGFRVDIAGKGL